MGAQRRAPGSVCAALRTAAEHPSPYPLPQGARGNNGGFRQGALKLLPFWGMLLLAPAAGCRRSRVEKPAGPIEPAMAATELPRQPETETAGAAPRWYYQVEDMPPGEVVELGEGPPPPADVIPLDEAPAAAAAPERSAQPKSAAELLAQVRSALEAKRPKDARWSLLRLELVKAPHRKQLEPQLVADVGLTDVYVRREVVSVEGLPLEQCLTRLTRQAGLRYSQAARTANPIVTYRREKVSLLEAIQEILADHRFSGRFTEVGLRQVFSLAAQPSREAFVEYVVAGLLAQGKKLDQGIPALLVAPP